MLVQFLMIYRVAGICVQVEGLSLPKPWALFRSPSPEQAPALTVVQDVLTPVNRDLSLLHLPQVSHMLQCDGVMVAADEEYRQFYVLQSHQPLNPVALAYFFYIHALRRQIIQIHAATIQYQGRGILFLGPSGVGKTTQAERWAQFRGASIINGDVGFVQRTPEGFLAWGTPWHGSSPYCLNTSVPIKALVVLKQAPYNALRELTGFEKLKEVSNNVFYPTWLEGGMELGVETLHHLLTELPVYRLDNRADLEAVELLERELNRIS